MATERRAKVAEQIEHLTMLFKKIRLFYDNVNEMCPDDPDDDVSKGRDVSLCKVIPSTWNPKHGIFSKHYLPYIISGFGGSIGATIWRKVYTKSWLMF